MKKLIALSVIAAIAVSMTACGGKTDDEQEDVVVQMNETEGNWEKDAEEEAAAPEETESSDVAISEGAAEVAAAEVPEITGQGDILTFSSTTFQGEPISSDIFAEADLIMINFWEPWCGPCVGEMPDLEKLYEDYKDQGFLILGVYTSPDMDDEIAEILEENGITYPILSNDENLAHYMTACVPTSFFVDSTGCVLSEEPIVGSYDYNGWEEIIKGYLD